MALAVYLASLPSPSHCRPGTKGGAPSPSCHRPCIRSSLPGSAGPPHALLGQTHVFVLSALYPLVMEAKSAQRFVQKSTVWLGRGHCNKTTAGRLKQQTFMSPVLEVGIRDPSVGRAGSS